MTTKTTRPQVGITPNMFGIAYGLAGLATCWGYAAILKLAPTVVADALFIITAAVWLVLIVGYLSQVARRPGGWRAELADPVMGPFVSLIPIVGMLLAMGLMPHSLTARRYLFGVFAAATTLLAGWITPARVD
jgi:tellurite resistance protein